MTENLDERLKKSTIGLVTLSDFQKTKDDLEEQQRQLAAQIRAEKTFVTARHEYTAYGVLSGMTPKAKKAKKKERNKLSFVQDEDDGVPVVMKRVREDDYGEIPKTDSADLQNILRRRRSSPKTRVSTRLSCQIASARKERESNGKS